MAERRRGFGYIRKLPSGRYQASYLGPDQVRHNAPITFEAKIDCEGWLASERRLIERDEWVAPTERAQIGAAAQHAASETVGTYANRWLAEGVAQGRLRPLTVVDYRRSLDLHLLPTLGDVRLSEVTRGTVRAWHDTTMANTAPRARLKAYALLRTVMNNAVHDELIAASPVQIRGAGVARRKHEIEPASLAELDAIVAAMPERLGLTVLLATWCALRYGEVADLRRKDVTLSSSQLRVARSVSFLPGGTQVGPPKTKAGARRVAVPPHVLPALEHHLKIFVKSGANALLLPGEAGGHLHESVLYRHWDRARKGAGRPDLRFHDLRHTGATLAAQAGATTAELQARLGHATPDAAMIHSEQYRTEFAADLKRMLPRIPLAGSREDFEAFTQAGRALSGLHVNYETVEPYPLHEQAPAFGDPWQVFRVEKLRWVDKTSNKAIRVNDQVTLGDIPAAAHRYMLGSRSALEWLIDRYQVKTDKASGIVNDPNDWGREHDDPRYMVDLIKRVTRVSVDTMKIVDTLPELPI